MPGLSPRSRRLSPLPLLVAGSLIAGPRVIRAQTTTPVPPAPVVPTPSPISAPRGDTRVCAGGDVTLGTNLDSTWAKRERRLLRARWGLSDHPESLLAPLRPLFADADVVLLNVEGAIGRGPAPRKCGPKSTSCFAFRQPVASARALRGVGADSTVVIVGNVANNHSRDAGDEGFAATRRHLEDAGVLVTGADTLATPVVTARGDTLAVLGFYTSRETPDARDLEAVRRHVARAVAQYGTVIVTAHIGAEGVNAQRTADATEYFLASRIDRGNPVGFATAAFDAGATVVVGHGPHVLRAAEWRGDRLALYSLGNLLTYGPFRLREPMNRGAVACFTIDSARAVSAAELRATRQLAPGVLAVDSTGRALTLVDSLSRLDFPRTGARIDPDGRVRKVEADSVSHGVGPGLDRD